MALIKRLTTKKGKEIIVKFENKRFWVQHTEISAKFVTADIALDNYFLSAEEKTFINDSIDALELIVLLEKNYGIKIEDPKDGKKIFASIRTMAKYILDNQKA